MGIGRASSICSPVRNLSLENIPPTAKLVMIVGPTGSGKSTILRTLKAATSVHRGQAWAAQACGIVFHGAQTLANQPVGDLGAAHFISEMFASAERNAIDSNQTAQEIVSDTFRAFAEMFQRIFPAFTVNALRRKPNDNIIQVTKGTASYAWQQMSSGELQIFEVLVKLMYGQKRYPSQLLFLDEPDKHVHAYLQAALLSECWNLIADGSQLWIATQSIGMIHKAVEMFRSKPGEIVFLEATLDYDTQTVLEPVTPDRNFVRRVLKVAIHDVADLVVARHIILCEGRPLGTGSPAEAEFDAKVLRTI